MLFSGVNTKAVEAPYKIGLRIAKEGKLLTAGNSLLPPAAKAMASSVFGEKVTKQLESIQLSNDTESRRISGVASNVKEQLTEKVKASKYYSNQLEEGADVSNTTHLVTVIRFGNEDSVKKEVLFCEPLIGRATSNDILKQLHQFMKVHDIE
jgi:hypothetical protein